MSYLALGGLIAAHLADLTRQWPRLAIVEGRELAAIRDGTARTAERLPAIHVLYAGDVLAASQARGAMQTIDQQWLVVPCVADLRESGESADTLGELIDAALLALQGWQPSDVHGELRRVQAPGPIYRGGVMRVPLQFRSRLLRLGERLI